MLLARSLKAPVFVGEDRYEAGLEAEALRRAAPVRREYTFWMTAFNIAGCIGILTLCYWVLAI